MQRLQHIMRILAAILSLLPSLFRLLLYYYYYYQLLLLAISTNYHYYNYCHYNYYQLLLLLWILTITTNYYYQATMQRLENIERILAASAGDFFLGDTFSLVDVALFPALESCDMQVVVVLAGGGVVMGMGMVLKLRRGASSG